MEQQERFWKKNTNPVRNKYNSFNIFIQTFNVEKICQVRVNSKNFVSIQTCGNNTKNHALNKRKIWHPCFKYIWYLNGMKMSWYSVCSLLFCFFVCLEPMVRKDTWMKTISVTFRVIFSKMAFSKLLFRSHVQSSFSTIYQAHWQQHFGRHLAVKILRAWNNIHQDLSKHHQTKIDKIAWKYLLHKNQLHKVLSLDVEEHCTKYKPHFTYFLYFT